MTSPTLSFEFFPPRNEAQSRRLWRTFGRLEALAPEWVSVTYGALGSASQASLDTVAAFQADTRIPVAAHLTCSGQTRAELEATLDYLESLGVRRIVALRGDAPSAPELAAPGSARRAGDQVVAPHEPVYHYANELVALVAERGSFDISVAGYPEVHPEAVSAQDDLHWLKVKLDAGASRVLTQFFFEADAFLRYRDRALKFGIDQPLVPGILPIHDINKVIDFSARCGATVPAPLRDQFAAVHDKRAAEQLAVEQCLNLCNTLQREGVHQFHFYTLNQSRLATLVAEALVTPEAASAVRPGISQENRQRQVATG